MFLVILHFSLKPLEFIQFLFFILCSLLDLFLKFNWIKGLWYPIGLHSLPARDCSWFLSTSSYATRRSRWLLMDLFEAGEAIFDAQRATLSLFLLLLFKLSSLERCQLLAALRLRALLAERQGVSLSEARIRRSNTYLVNVVWNSLIAHLVVLMGAADTTVITRWRDAMVRVSREWCHAFDDSALTRQHR